jgi:hypothetical protein
MQGDVYEVEAGWQLAARCRRLSGANQKKTMSNVTAVTASPLHPTNMLRAAERRKNAAHGEAEGMQERCG